MAKKFLDAEGVKYLWSKVSLEDYPNNETLIAILNAIDQTKVDKIELDKYLLIEDYVADVSYKAPDIVTQSAFMYQNVMSVLEHLSNREKTILINRFGLNGCKKQTLEEIGKKMGFSKERIRQIESIAIKKLKEKEDIAYLKEYLN